MDAKKLREPKPAKPTTNERDSLRVRTGLKGGDVYMQWPRGSNG